MEQSDLEQQKRAPIKSLLLTLVICLWLSWLWNRRHLYRFAYKLPGYFGRPLFGIFGTRIIDPKKLFFLFEKIYTECKSYTVCVWMGIKPVMVVADPDVAERFLSNYDFPYKAEFYRPMSLVLGGTLIDAPPHIWRHNRRVIMTSFSHKVLLSFFPILNRAKLTGISKLDDMVGKGEHQLRHTLRRLGIGISVETTTGYQLKEGDPNDEGIVRNIVRLVKASKIGIVSSFFNLDYVHRSTNTYNNIIKYCYGWLDGLVQDKLKQRAELKTNPELLANGDGKNDSYDDAEDSLMGIKKTANIFLDLAIDNYEKKIFKWQDIHNESGTLIMAAFETTASVVLSAIVMLAMHPEYQERLFEEIVNYYPDKDFEMKYEDIKELPYLTMFINECLRVSPSIPLIGRHIVEDIPYDKNLILPKGLEVMIDVFHIHRRADLWGPNADKFNPDNFLPENIKDRHPYAYIPFSKGLHSCIGYRYAYNSISVLLSGFVRNFRFTTSFKYEDLSYCNDIAIRFYKEPGIEVHRRET